MNAWCHKLFVIAHDPVVMDEVVVIREVPPTAPLVPEVTACNLCFFHIGQRWFLLVQELQEG